MYAYTGAGVSAKMLGVDVFTTLTVGVVRETDFFWCVCALEEKHTISFTPPFIFARIPKINT